MGTPGISTGSFTPVDTADEVLVNSRLDGVLINSGRMAMAKLGQQLLAGGPIAETLDQLGQRVTAVEIGDNPKLDVAVATFANVDLTTGLVAGLTVNGVLLVAGMRVAVLGQATGATITETTGPYPGRTNSPANGVRIVQAAPGLAPRATDMDTGPELLGAEFFVTGGTVGMGATFKCAATGEITPGVTGLLFVVSGGLGDVATRTVTGTGFATGGGAISANPVITVPKATATTVLDKLIDTAAVSPKTLDDRLTRDFGTAVTDEEFAVVLVYAADGTPLVAVRYDGTFYSRASRIVTDGYWEWAYTDADGVVLMGKPWARSYMLFGPFYPGREYVHDAVGRIDAGNAYVITDTRQVRLTFGAGSTALAIDVRGNDAVYKIDTGGVLSTVREDLLALTSLSPQVTKVRLRILMGQSLSNGGAAIPAITVDPPVPGRVVMYNGGVRVLGNSQDGSYPTTPVPDLNLLSWVDAVERTDGTAGESPACGMGERLAATYPATEAVLLAGCGIGGQGSAAIGPGTVPDANVRRVVIRSWIICQLLGLQMEVVVHMDHGETDRAAASGVYKGWMVALQAHYTAIVQSIVPGHGEVKLFVSGLANWSAYALAASTVPDDQAAAARENPGKIYLSGSRYPLATGSDGIHLTPAASKALGQQHADAELRVAAGQPSCFQVLSGVRTGNEIILSGDVPVGTIVRDAATVTDPGPELAAAVPPIVGNKYGFRYVQTGGTPVVVDDVVTHNGDTQIKVILSGDPGAVSAQSLRIAMDGVSGNHGGPTTGPRACFRDSGGNWLTARILPVT